MGALYLLLPISLILVVLIGAAFWWAIFSGQFEDTDAAARSILEDDDTPESNEANKSADKKD
ncbi:MAG: cbb3-type cytochrome oxidase assembly protein CcoS [Pusillimonas sp.]|jgi:cbb3-type cytochrome oxidase maturation protein|nr:cbb3-type cytochrome oxidase assembly protein CcoS [Pusillimonas sp.]|tara:strand:- start:402 stop:587 length:186 start_codon:yes stop_codon:yes gene_type:complete